MKKLLLFLFAILTLPAIGAAASEVVISTDNSTMILEASAGKPLRYMYYGGRLTSRDLELKSYMSSSPIKRQAYPSFGQGTMHSYAIAATHPDGNMTLDLTVESFETKSDTTIFHLKDKIYPFYVDVCYKVYPKDDIIETWTQITNKEKKTVVLRKFDSVMLPVRVGNVWCTHFHGDFAAEAGLTSGPLCEGNLMIDGWNPTRTNHSDHGEVMLSLDGEPREDSGRTIGAALCYQGAFEVNVETSSDDFHYLSAGINSHHSSYPLKKGETLVTPSVALCYSDQGMGGVSRSFHRWGRENKLSHPQAPRRIVLNSWEGAYFNIDEKVVGDMMEDASELGVELFVMDDGWFGGAKYPRNGDSAGLGDWCVNKEKLPRGLQPLVDKARACGIDFGIWLEPETCGEKSDGFNNKCEHLVTRYGKVLTCGRRRFWNLQDPWVWEYLCDSVIGTMKREGIKYIKIDSNETLGAGMDGAESFGEALRKHSLKMEEFYQKITDEIPDAVIENVSAGGARAIYSFTCRSSVTSFSDSFDVPNNPIVSANMLRLIPARQNLIWCILDRTYKTDRVYYSLCSATLGRMCLSGDIASLSDEHNRLLDEFIAYYKKCVPVIRKGTTRIYLNSTKNYVNPKGYQAVVRTGDNSDVVVTVHSFEPPYPETITVSLPAAGYSVSDRFVQEGLSVSVEQDTLVIKGMKQYQALSVLLKKAASGR